MVILATCMELEFIREERIRMALFLVELKNMDEVYRY